jgi:hypothetical protein
MNMRVQWRDSWYSSERYVLFSYCLKQTLFALISAKEVFVSIPSSPYRSLELEQIQQRSTSPLGMLFLRVPVVQVSVPAQRDGATTRSCDETSNDGKSTLDCVDDDD